MTRKLRILFICYDGATKSQLATALTKAHAAEHVEAASAGLYTAKSVAEPTRRAIETRGLPLPDPARHAPEASPRWADLIVSFVPGAPSMYGRPTLHWRPRTLALAGDQESHALLLAELEPLVVTMLAERNARKVPQGARQV